MLSSIWISPKTARPITQTGSWPSPHVATQASELESSALLFVTVSLYNCNGYTWVCRHVVGRLVDCCMQEIDGILWHYDQIGEGWPWTHNRISHEISADSFQFWGLFANMRRQRWSGVNLRHQSGGLERYPTATQRLWTLQTKAGRPLRLIKFTLILDIDKKAFASWYGKWAVCFMWSSPIKAHISPVYHYWFHKHGVGLLDFKHLVTVE